MSEIKQSVKTQVMERILSGQAVMRPKWMFWAGSAALFAGLVASVVSGVFFVSVTTFLLRAHGPMASLRLSVIMGSFPWWVPLAAAGSLLIGVWALKQYDFSYRKNTPAVILIFAVAVIMAGVLIDALQFDDAWFARGPMNGIMRQYMRDTQRGRMNGARYSP